MDREQALAKLRSIKPGLVRRYGLVRLGLFGSVARGEATPESDTDVVVDAPITNAWEYLALREEIETALGGRVDIVRLRRGLRSSLRSRIEQEAVYV